MRVNFVANPPSARCGCSSLLEHWESATHRKATRCSVATCTMPAGDAIVVTKSDEADTSPYVVSVCRGHALQKGGVLELRNMAELIPYSPQGTCTHLVSARAAT